MRRYLALALTFGSFAAGLGCKHIAGVCDCSHNPEQATLTPATQPYPASGAPIPSQQVPEKMPAPAPAPLAK